MEHVGKMEKWKIETWAHWRTDPLVRWSTCSLGFLGNLGFLGILRNLGILVNHG